MPDSKKSSSTPKVETRDNRLRNYACVVYPESAPDNWLNIISESKIPVIISPLHDKDLNPTGEPKKPHHHVVAAYEGKKSPEQARQFFESFGGVGLEPVQSLRGYARYLCHLDNPEKAQYSVEDVKSFGIDYVGTIGLPTDKYKAIGEMIDWVEANDIESFAELMVFARSQKYDWFRVLCDSSTLVMKEYIKSRSWKRVRSYPGIDEDGVIFEPSAPRVDEVGLNNKELLGGDDIRF